MSASPTGIQDSHTGAEQHNQSTSQLSIRNAFHESPYAVQVSIDAPNVAEKTLNSEMKKRLTPAVQKRILAPKLVSPHLERKPASKSIVIASKTREVAAGFSASVSEVISSRSQTRIWTDPTQEFQKEEAKILSIIRSQISTTAAFAEMNSYVDGDYTISLRELSMWLPINFPRLNNSIALKLAIKNAKRLQFLQEQQAGSRDALLTKLRSPQQDQRKIELELEELPSFLENLLAFHRIAKLVSSIDPSGELKLTKLEVYGFLTAIRISSSSEIGKGLVQKIGKSSCLSFEELCRISFDMGFLSHDVRNANNQLSREWDFNTQKPDPVPPPVRRIKSHQEVQSEVQAKILKQTRSQDVMSTSIVPYMVKSRLRAIKHRHQHLAHLSESSTSSVASSCVSSLGRYESSNIQSTRPNSANKMTSLWKHGNTPRQSVLHHSPFSLNGDSSLLSRTQRSFEQGSILDTRRQNPLYIDTQNGETIYEMPVMSSTEYMKYCPIAQEVFKRIVNQPEHNPLAFATSRTPRLYGVHTSKPGVMRRDFVCTPQTDTFFHNVDINTRRQYRPCTAGSLENLRAFDERTTEPKPSWCFGAVPWNGKSTDLPKYSGDIGFFEPNQFKKRFDPDRPNSFNNSAWK
jgi:hypothetical protein